MPSQPRRMSAEAEVPSSKMAVIEFSASSITASFLLYWTSIPTSRRMASVAGDMFYKIRSELYPWILAIKFPRLILVATENISIFSQEHPHPIAFSRTRRALCVRLMAPPIVAAPSRGSYIVDVMQIFDRARALAGPAIPPPMIIAFLPSI